MLVVGALHDRFAEPVVNEHVQVSVPELITLNVAVPLAVLVALHAPDAVHDPPAGTVYVAVRTVDAVPDNGSILTV